MPSTRIGGHLRQTFEIDLFCLLIEVELVSSSGHSKVHDGCSLSLGVVMIRKLSPFSILRGPEPKRKHAMLYAYFIETRVWHPANSFYIGNYTFSSTTSNDGFGSLAKTGAYSTGWTPAQVAQPEPHLRDGAGLDMPEDSRHA